MVSEVVIAITLAAEALSTGEIGMRRVYTILVNRAGTEQAEVVAKECLKPHQFSCWQDRGLIARVEKDSIALLRGKQALKKGIVADVGRSKHYLAHWLYHSKRCPKWAKGGKVVLDEGIGGHVFLEGIR